MNEIKIKGYQLLEITKKLILILILIPGWQISIDVFRELRVTAKLTSQLRLSETVWKPNKLQSWTKWMKN